MTPQELEAVWDPPVEIVSFRRAPLPSGAMPDISVLGTTIVTPIRLKRTWFTTPNRIHGLQHRVIHQNSPFLFCGYLCPECEECFLVTVEMAQDNNASLLEGIRHKCTENQS